MIDLDEKRTFWSALDIAKVLMEQNVVTSRNISLSSITALPDGISGRQIIETVRVLRSMTEDNGHYERPEWHGRNPFVKFAELIGKIDESLRCEATTTDGLIGTPPIECFLPRGHHGLHRTKENGEWTWEF